MPKSALDRYLELPKHRIVEKLDCPEVYGLRGIYRKEDCMETIGEVSVEQCKICWTKKV
jgi:hypothetical protein